MKERPARRTNAKILERYQENKKENIANHKEPIEGSKTIIRDQEPKRAAGYTGPLKIFLRKNQKFSASRITNPAREPRQTLRTKNRSELPGVLAPLKKF